MRTSNLLKRDKLLIFCSVMYIVFSLSVQFIEGPHTKAIYKKSIVDKKKKAVVDKKKRTKKNK